MKLKFRRKSVSHFTKYLWKDPIGDDLCKNSNYSSLLAQNDDGFFSNYDFKPVMDATNFPNNHTFGFDHHGFFEFFFVIFPLK